MDENFTFISPTECPVFKPTAEEFKDPLEYIEQISPIAIKTGICKIVPPDGWRPPFSVDVNTFQFTPRVQKLYELEAQSRIKLNFMTKLAQFVRLQGSDKLKVPNINGKHVDLYKLHKLVQWNGGYDHINANKLWSKIGTKMGYKVQSHVYGLKTQYEKIIMPYDMMLEGNNSEESFFNSSNGQPKPVLHPSTIKKRKAINVQVIDETGMQSNEFKRLQFRGAGPKTFVTVKDEEKPDLSLISGPLKRKCLSDIVCKICGSGDREERLLICDNSECQDCYHCDCLNPPIAQVPKQSWKCQNCVLKVLTKKPLEYGFPSSSMTYSLYEFGKSADRFKANYFGKDLHEIIPCSVVEKEFWRILQSFNDDVVVEYGADIHSSHQGSGFPTFANIANGKCARNNGEDNWDLANQYSKEQWNLNILPVNRKSILRFIRGNIDGMKIPWCYVGMIFSSFCWHIEDHWSYSINYLHWGEPKTWYGVSSENADLFERSMRKMAPELFENHEDLLHHITTIMNPNILGREGVPIFRTDQQAGEFVITFPRAYHAGFNQGFNFAEAVNFCPANWLPKGRDCVEHYAQLHRHCVFSHEELLCTIAEASLLEQECATFVDPTCYPLMAGLGLPISEILLDTNIRRIVHSELEIVMRKERVYHDKLKILNITRSRRTLFESMVDDERACVMCQTTCFMSALECNCINEDLKFCESDSSIQDRKVKKIYCLRHIDNLCSICPVTEIILLFRFTIDEMNNLLSGLEIRLQDFHLWESDIKRFCTEGPIPNIKAERWTVEHLQMKLKEGKQCKFDSCDQFMKAKALLDRGRNLISVCNHWSRQLQNSDKQSDSRDMVPKSVLVDCLHEDGTIDIRNVQVGSVTEDSLFHMLQTINGFPLRLPCDSFVHMVDRLKCWRTESNALMESIVESNPADLLPNAVKLFEEAKKLFPGWAAFINERMGLMLFGKSLQWLVRIRECEESVKNFKTERSLESPTNLSLPKKLVKEEALLELVNHGEKLSVSLNSSINSGMKDLIFTLNTINAALSTLYKINKEIIDIRSDLIAVPKRGVSAVTLNSLRSITNKCLALGIRVKDFDDFRVKIYKLSVEVILNQTSGKFIDLNHALEILDVGSTLFNEEILDCKNSVITQKHVAAKTQVTLVNRSIRKLKSAYTVCIHETGCNCDYGSSDKDFLKCLLPRHFSTDIDLNKNQLVLNCSEFSAIWGSTNPSDDLILSLMKKYQAMVVDELKSVDSLVESVNSESVENGWANCNICGISQVVESKLSFCSTCIPRTKRPTINEIAQLNKLLKQSPGVLSIFGVALQALSKRTVTWLESLVALFRLHVPYLSVIFDKIKNDKSLNIPVCVRELFLQRFSVTESTMETDKVKELVLSMRYLRRVGFCIEVNVDAYINVIEAFIACIEKRSPRMYCNGDNVS